MHIIMKAARHSLFGLGLTVLGSMAVHAQSTQTSNQTLDQEMVAALSLNATQSQVQTAVDGMLAISGVDPSIADSSGATMALVDEQLEYLAGSQPGLTEDNVATAVNDLASDLSLPNYAQTTDAEVRQLHVALIQAYPQTILAGGPVSGSLVKNPMSPLEQVLLFSTLVHQKLSNPQYQMTTTEYAAYYSALQSGATPPTPTDHTADMRNAITAATANWTQSTLDAYINSTQAALVNGDNL
jgi:hypothetical protein